MDPLIIQNKQAHDKIASIYELKHREIYNDIEQKRLRLVISELIKIPRNRGSLKVLDVGAGTGNLSKKFLEHDCEVVACDLSENILATLKEQVDAPKRLQCIVFDGKKLPFKDNTFDIVATYSVLHHIPDYIFTVKEMIRVAKQGGCIYIDHEANEKKWNPSKSLQEYYKVTKKTPLEHVAKLYKTRELFSLDPIKALFITLFQNKRYKREGDIHVWPDDHIEWDKILQLADRHGCNVVKEIDYLLHRVKGGVDLYKRYQNRCTDTKYIILQKESR